MRNGLMFFAVFFTLTLGQVSFAMDNDGVIWSGAAIQRHAAGSDGIIWAGAVKSRHAAGRYDDYKDGTIGTEDGFHGDYGFAIRARHAAGSDGVIWPEAVKSRHGAGVAYVTSKSSNLRTANSSDSFDLNQN